MSGVDILETPSSNMPRGSIVAYEIPITDEQLPPTRFLAVTGEFNKEDGFKHPLEQNIGIIAISVNAVMPAYPARQTVIFGGLSRKIRNAIVGGIQTYGTTANRDDLFQECVLAFLMKRENHIDDLGAFSTYIIPNMLGLLSRQLPIVSSGVAYPQASYTKKPDKTEFVEMVDMPDYDGYGYDDDDTYLSRWLPIEDAGVTPRYDVVAEPSDKISEIIGNSTFIEALNSLPNRDLEILTLYFTPHVTEKGEAQPRTLEGVSEELGLEISKEGIRQIISKSIVKIHKKMAEIENEKEQDKIDASKPRILTPTERELKRRQSNKENLQKLAEAKLALGGMVINNKGVVIKEKH